MVNELTIKSSKLGCVRIIFAADLTWGNSGWIANILLEQDLSGRFLYPAEFLAC